MQANQFVVERRAGAGLPVSRAGDRRGNVCVAPFDNSGRKILIMRIGIVGSFMAGLACVEDFATPSGFWTKDAHLEALDGCDKQPDSGRLELTDDARTPYDVGIAEP